MLDKNVLYVQRHFLRLREQQRTTITINSKDSKGLVNNGKGSANSGDDNGNTSNNRSNSTLESNISKIFTSSASSSTPVGNTNTDRLLSLLTPLTNRAKSLKLFINDTKKEPKVKNNANNTTTTSSKGKGKGKEKALPVRRSIRARANTKKKKALKRA